MQDFQMLCDGRWVNAHDGRWIDSFNPYTGEAWARVARDADELSAIREYLQEKSIWISTGGDVPNPFVMR